MEAGMKRQSQKPRPPKPRAGHPIYDGVGSVKRHEECASHGGSFSLHLKGTLLFLSSTKARFVNPSGRIWFHQPSIRSPVRGTMIRSSDAPIKFVARLIVRATRPLPLGSSSSCLQLPSTRLFALRNEVTIAVDLIPILDQFLVRQRMRQR